MLCLFFTLSILSIGYTKEPPETEKETPSKAFKKQRYYGNEGGRLRKLPVNAKLENAVERLKGKDTFLPVLAQLATRHLASGKYQNDLDTIFDKALARHPNVKPEHLRKIVDAYNSISFDLKTRKFEMPESQESGRATTAAITLKQAQAMLKKNTGQSRLPELAEKPSEPERKAQTDTDLKTAVIFGINPQFAEPGETITITGRRFNKEKDHHVIFSPAGSSIKKEERKVVVMPMTDEKIMCMIPPDIYSGMYEIRVEAPGFSINANKVEYEVSTPKYSVSFNTMRCVNQTVSAKNNKVPKDSLVTFWTVVSDDKVWTKASHKYNQFTNGTYKDYYSTDKYILPIKEDFAEIKYGMAIQTDLYEWNVTSEDPQVMEGVMDFSFDLAKQIIAPANAWDLPGTLSPLLEYFTGIVVDIFSQNPVLIGSNQIAFTSIDLQKKLKPDKKETSVLEFTNDKEGGIYKLNYTISRKKGFQKTAAPVKED